MPTWEKRKRSKINTLSSKWKELEEQDQRYSKASRRQEITKIRAELKEIQTHIHKNLSENQLIQELVFWKDQQNRQTTSQINRKEKGEELNRCNKKMIKVYHYWFHRNTNKIRDYYKQLYAHKPVNLEEMD